MKVTALQELANKVIEKAFGVDPATWPLTEIVYVAFMFAAATAVFVFALHFAGLFIFFERRIAARMQSRVGPNRVGPNGILQWAVDGVKCLFKEDLVPEDADHFLFRIAPYFVVLGMVLAFAALPFSSALIATDINIGILFILGITSLVVIGVLLAGWGSNSKWALLGGMRSAAQVISYEIPAALAAMTVIITSGSLSMQSLIKSQGGSDLLPSWGVFHSPFTLIAFFVFFVAQLAEGNRTPFDLPEAESELVSGYNTEYSGMRFLMFFLGEFANVWILCAVSVALFLGGWQIPFGTQADGITPSDWLVATSGPWLLVMAVGAAAPALLIGVQLFRYRSRAHDAISKAEVPGSFKLITKLLLRGSYDGAAVGHVLASVGLVAFGFFQLGVAGIWTEIRVPLVINGLQLGIFFAKTLALVFIVIQLRWTLPRIRVDQMMVLCWKYLVPLSFVCVLGTLLWELILESTKFGMSRSPLDYAMRWAMFAAFCWVLSIYAKKIRAVYQADRDNYQNHTGHEAYYPPWRLV
jgi:NADH:ubiquinone oxidoreductase subunit H